MTYGYYAEIFKIELWSWQQDRTLSKARDSVLLWNPELFICLRLNKMRYKVIGW